MALKRFTPLHFECWCRGADFDTFILKAGSQAPARKQGAAGTSICFGRWQAGIVSNICSHAICILHLMQAWKATVLW